MKQLPWLILFAFAFSACKTNLVYISVKVPAPVTVPASVKTAAILNRSIPGEDTKLNNVHRVLSGQTIAMLKEGSAAAVSGLKEALTDNNRFDQVKILEGIKTNTPGAGIFPSPLSWDEAAALCRTAQAELLFALELFDTDLKVNPNSAPDLSTPSSTIASVLTTDVSFTTTVRTGWRIYDPKAKKMIDEDSFNRSFTFTGNAITAAQTAEVLIGRKETIKKTANEIGRDYAQQIMPYWLRVSRDYFVKGNSNFKKATRMARAGNWDSAAEVWKRETTNPKNKIAGRACYNMAIIGEIDGDIDTAITWAQKSYEEHNNKTALRYLRILKDRKLEMQRLEIQE